MPDGVRTLMYNSLFPKHIFWADDIYLISLTRIWFDTKTTLGMQTIIKYFSLLLQVIIPPPQNVKDFLQTWLNCSPQQGDVQNPCWPCVSSMCKVTIEGQISNNQKLDIMLCPLCKSYTNWKIFLNLGSNVHFNKGMCRTHVTLLPA